MENKFTPGPWCVRFGGQTGRPVSVTPVLKHGSIAKPATPEALANARLIAAAPALYEALEKLLSMRQPECDFVIEARAALKLARGEEVAS